MTLTNNEAKDKLIKYLQDRINSLKKTTKKINIQKGGLLIFLALLTRVALPFKKSVLMPLAKRIFHPPRLTLAVSTIDAFIQKKVFRSGRPC